MIFGRLGVIQRDQRGLTLVELLIAILLAGIVTSGITMTIFQVFNMNSRTSSHMVAIRQVQHAGKQVSQDLLQAQGVDLGGGSGFPLTLAWTDWDDAQHEIDYTLEDMAGGLKKLQRSHSVNGGEPTVILVAEYIDLAETSCVCNCVDGCDCDNLVLTFTVTANVGGQSETRVYEVTPRAG